MSRSHFIQSLFHRTSLVKLASSIAALVPAFLVVIFVSRCSPFAADSNAATVHAAGGLPGAKAASLSLEDLERALRANAWCSLHAVRPEEKSGELRGRRQAQFQADGTLLVRVFSPPSLEEEALGAQPRLASQTEYNWRLEPDQRLALSSDGAQWASYPLQPVRTGDGHVSFLVNEELWTECAVVH